MSSSPKTRPREQDTTGEPCAKRAKVDDTDVDTTASADTAVAVVNIADIEDQEDMDVDAKGDEPETLLPPSHALLNTKRPVYGSDGSMQQIMETDVGISEYIGFDVPKIEGIIKQRCAIVFCYSIGSMCRVHMFSRFTDFLVFEVDQDSQVIHLKTLTMPSSSKKGPDAIPAEVSAPSEPVELAVDENKDPESSAASTEQPTEAVVTHRPTDAAQASATEEPKVEENPPQDDEP